MRRLAGLLLGAGLLAVLLSGCGAEAGGPPEVRFRFSEFSPGLITARAGEAITISLRNDDPIEHEWIIGPPDVHDRHRTGTEARHDEIPTEVTLAPFSTRLTTVRFDQPGDYAFVCHLPGHEAYGMRGVLRVLPS